MKIRIAYIGLLSLLMLGCSSTTKVKEPTALAPLDSLYTLDRQWQVKMQSMPSLDSEGLFFAEDNEKLYAASSTGHVVALSKQLKTRWIDQVTWQTKFSSPVVSGPAKYSDQLIVGTAKGLLMSLSAETGQVSWQAELSSEVMSHAVISEGHIFTRTVDGKLYSVDAKSGEITWVVEHQMPSLSLRGAPAVLVHEGSLYVGWESGVVQALSAKSGALLWEARVAIPKGRTDLERMVDIQSSLVIQNNRLFVLGFHGKLAAIDPNNGEFFFVKELSGYSDFVVDESNIYVADDQDVLHAFDLLHGTNLWKQEALKGRVLGDLSFYGDYLLVTDAWGYMHWVDRLQGVETARLKHSDEYGGGNKIVRSHIDGSMVTLLDGDGFVTRYLIKPSDLALFRAKHNE